MLEVLNGIKLLSQTIFKLCIGIPGTGESKYYTNTMSICGYKIGPLKVQAISNQGKTKISSVNGGVMVYFPQNNTWWVKDHARALVRLRELYENSIGGFDSRENYLIPEDYYQC